MIRTAASRTRAVLLVGEARFSVCDLGFGSAANITVAAVAAAMIGQPGIPLSLLFVVVAVAGFCFVGGQPAVNALAATYYPTTLRSTGVGWSLGVGRVGSVLGPVLGGELIRRDWSNSAIFLAVAVPAVISAVMMLLLARENGRVGGNMAGVSGSINH